jgi:gliding motility-associated protein GldE
MFPNFYFSLILILFLLFLSGLISGSEVAFFSLSKEILNEYLNRYKNRQRKLKLILKLFEHPNKLLLTILIGNTVVDMGISVAGAILAINLSYLLEIDTRIAVSIEVIIITLLILIFGEIFPKVISARNPLAFAIFTSPLINFMFILLYPMTETIFLITNFIQKKFPKSKTKLSLDEIKPLIEIGERYGVIEKEEQGIIKNLLQFEGKTVRDAMTSRVDMVAVEENLTLNEIVKVIRETGLSRLPVYRGQIDNITGILYAKDIIPFLSGRKKREKFEIKKILKEPIFVPETKTLNSLLQEFKQKKMHIAIVVDEFGGTAGLVTLDDIISEIFGEIATERETPPEKLYAKIDNSTFIFDAMIPLEKANEILKTDLKMTNSDYDTLGGFILEITGRIPRENETIVYDNLKFTVEKVEHRRIKRLKVVKNV